MPSPRRRTPSPGEYVSPRSPRRSSPRLPSPSKIRLGSHSIITSPRFRARDPDERHNSREHRSRLLVRSRSRNRLPRTASPSRSANSPKRRPISRSRSRSPRRRRDSSDSSYRRRTDSRERTPPTPPRPLRTTEAKETEKPDRAIEKEKERHAEQPVVREPPQPIPALTPIPKPEHETSKAAEDPQPHEKPVPKPLPPGLPPICYPPGQYPSLGEVDFLPNLQPAVAESRPKYHLVDPLLRPRTTMPLLPLRPWLAKVPNFSKVDEQQMAYFEIPAYKSWQTPTFEAIDIQISQLKHKVYHDLRFESVRLTLVRCR